MKIGVYVGSFNPVHKGHVRIANTIINNGYVDKLLVIPTLSYWDKKGIISLEDRANMLKFYETDKIIVDTVYSNLQYTYQIINALKERHKDVEFSLIIGADNIVNFDKWMHYDELLELTLIIAARNDIDIKYYLDKLNKKDKYIIVDIDDMDISSTKVRENIDNEMVLRRYLDPKVIGYIKDHNLYKE